jgi:hypothetical protein
MSTLKLLRLLLDVSFPVPARVDQGTRPGVSMPSGGIGSCALTLILSYATNGTVAMTRKQSVSRGSFAI